CSSRPHHLPRSSPLPYTTLFRSFDFSDTEPITTRRLDVHSQLVPIFTGDHGGKGHRRTHTPVQSRTGPDGAPSIAGDEILEVLSEVVDVGVGSIHVCI